jgi:hypothetical protein
MPFNGSGTYTLPAGNPVTTGTTISSTTTNSTNSDIATALSNCVTRDGQSPATANLPLGGFKVTGLAAGSSNGDSVRYEQVQYLANVGSAGTSGQVLTSAGTGAPTWETPAAGISLSADNTWTGTQSFTGSTSKLAEVLTNAGEVCTISATAATGTINFDVTTQSVLYYTSNASANWTVNFRGSSGTSLNTLMSVGQSVTVAFMVTQGSTAYYNSAVTIDGSSVTPKYQGGAAWTSGNASSIDAYVYTIIKTGSAAFTVLASQTQFK